MDLRITKRISKLRVLFIVALTFFFVSMFYIMNLSYNPFNRNKTINSKNIELIETYLTPEEQDFLISEVVDVNLFLKYITYDNFVLKHYQQYNIIQKLSVNSSPELVVNSFETLNLNIEDFEVLLEAYTLDQVYVMKTEGSVYQPNSQIVFRPQKDDALVNNANFIYSYKPRTLVQVPETLTLNDTPLYLEAHIIPQLVAFCDAASLHFNEPDCGGMEIFSAYRSYEEQQLLYNFYIESGIENVDSLVNYPGHSDKQLGKSIYLSDIFYGTDFIKTQKAQFIRDESYKYGFILRYPEGKEAITGKTGDASTLRYVGIELATKLKEKNLTLEEYYETLVNTKK